MIDPTVKKILNNGGFIAALAPVLAAQDLTKGYPTFYRKVRELATAAKVYRKMLATIGVSVTVNGDWEGCEQAQQLIRWIIEPDFAFDPAAAHAIVNGWVVEIWSAVTELAAGKVPKPT